MNLKFRQMKKWFAVAAMALPVASAVSQETNAVNPRDFAAFQIVNNRNIFDPNRRPPRVESPRDNTPRQPQIVDTFSLVGTMSYSGKLLAFFDGSRSDYRRSLAVGDRIATYSVGDIQHNLVKLQSGTNQIELKVGMQLRRTEDGSWSMAEAPAGGVASTYTGNRQRGNDRSSWGRNNSRWGGQTSSSSTTGSSSGSSETSTPNLANLDPNDPVARMMLRRMQEEGIVPPQNNANTQTVEGQPNSLDPSAEGQSSPQQQRQQSQQSEPESSNEVPGNPINQDSNFIQQSEQPFSELRS